MALKEQDIVLVSKDVDGTKVIQMPITRVENVEGAIKTVNGTSPDAQGNVKVTSVDKATKATQDEFGNNINEIYSKKTDVVSALATKADKEHSHTISDVSGLDTALAGKQPKGDYSVEGHTHTTGSITDLSSVLASKQDKGNYVTSVNGVAPDSKGSVTVNAVPPSITATATTLPAGSQATVSRGGTDAAPTFTFGIPQGAIGPQGPQGPRGQGFNTVTNAGTTGPAGNVTIGVAQTASINIPFFTVNSYGQVTSRGTRVLKISTGGGCSNCNNCSDCNNCGDSP